MKNTTRALLFLLLLLPVLIWSQVSITNASPTVLLNFSNSMPITAGTNPSTAFTGAGFSPNPTIAGRLNSNAWDVKGFSYGTLGFGGIQTVDAYGRGSVTTGVITHGVYAFTELPGSVANPALMVQPLGTEFSPGSIILKIRNNGTSSITQLQVEYNLFVRNDENKSSSFNFSHSVDNLVYQDESLLDYASPETADALEWVSVGLAPSRSLIITGLNIAPGALYYLRWSSEEISGTGNSDEFGLDDIRVVGTYGTPAPEVNVTGFSTTILHNDTTPNIADGTQFSSLASPTSTLSTTVSRTYEIQNLGGDILTTSTVTITGLNPEDFTIFAAGTSSPGAIPAVSGGVISVKQLTIAFDPSTPGLRRAIVNIANDDANENPYVFHIQGYGFDPVPEIDMIGHTVGTASIIDGSLIPTTGNNTLFDPQTVGVTNQTKDFRIRNVGTLTLQLTDPSPYVTISGTNPGDFTLVTIPTSSGIIPGSFRTFSINFNPSATGIRTAMVSIANNDSNENPYNFLIQGTGITPEADISGNGQPIASGSTIPTFVNDTFFDYINVASGTIDRVFTIQNSGNAVLTIGSITISGVSGADYTVISLPTSPLAVGATTTFAIRFDPSAIGLRDALVTIVNNDLNENPYTFAISGYGLDYTGCDFGARETIAIQDFETTPATPTWSYALTGATATLTTAVGYAVSGDGGLSSRFLGATALQNAGNGTGVLTMSNINTTTFSDVELNLRVSAYSTSLTNGLDNTDRVVVAVSTNGGSTWSNEIQVQGLLNSVWDYTAGIGTASKSYTGFNAATIFAPTVAPATINYQTTEGYSTVVLSNLPKVANLAIRVSVTTNSAQEVWTIDNVTLFGRKELTSTWDGAVWSNGQPTSGMKAILDADYNTNLHGNLLGCKCQINSGKKLTVDTATYALIESNLESSGSILIENNGSLVQRNDFAVNSGSMSVKRATSPMKLYDYTYWSSPVGGQTLTNLSPQTSPDRFYAFNPATGNWQYALGTTVMSAGKGYIVRSPESFNATPAVYNGQFAGSIQNGFTQTPIVIGTSPWNLIGNPYASAIDADVFLGFGANTGLIGGTIYLWTHNTAFANNVYTVNDYAVYNLLGGIGTAAMNLGVNNTVPTGKIASGQGFFVQGLANGNVTFNNTMRVTGNNSEFFRNQNVNHSGDIEKNRIWLNLTNSQGAFKQTLVGYVQNATNGIDRDFDGTTLNAGNVINFYSLCNNEILAIQGRALPFNTSETVPLGYASSLAGTFSIAVENFDGLFTAMEGIYLEDQLLHVIHNLKSSPYTFTTATGTFNTRFVLRFTNSSLGTSDFGDENTLIVTSDNHKISLLSERDNIASVVIYDLLGRSLLQVKNISDTDYTTVPIANQQALIVKVTFENGAIETRKVMVK